MRTFWPGLDVALIAQELEGGGRGHADRRSLLEGQVGRLEDELVLVPHRRTRRMRPRTTRRPRHPVGCPSRSPRSPRRSPRYPSPDRVLRPAQSGRHPHEVRGPAISTESPTWIDAACTRTRTSPPPTSGFSMSLSRSVSSAPYCSCTIAFIAVLPRPAAIGSVRPRRPPCWLRPAARRSQDAPTGSGRARGVRHEATRGPAEAAVSGGAGVLIRGVGALCRMLFVARPAPSGRATRTSKVVVAIGGNACGGWVQERGLPARRHRGRRQPGAAGT